MLSVCVAGVTGWTGCAVARAIDRAEDMLLTSGVSRSTAGMTLAQAIKVTSDGLVFGSVSEAIQGARVDVLVDFTSANAVKANVWAAVQAGVHTVVGSSGLSADDYKELDSLARKYQVGVIAAGNFSVVAAVLKRSASFAVQYLRHWEILDYASDTKPDVPSGTSRELAETLAELRRPEYLIQPSELHGPPEARGAEISGTRIHSIRLPGYAVGTEIVFGEPGERLVMRHDPGPGPTPYVEGTLIAVRNVRSAVGLRRGLDSIVFADQALIGNTVGSDPLGKGLPKFPGKSSP